MEISLKSIEKSNWEECIQLKVREDQEDNMASNLYSIAEVQFLNGFICKAIYLDEAMIGFVMYGMDPDDNNYWIYRFMIDERYQNNGYGKKALQLVVEEINIQENKTDKLLLGYSNSNETARRLYRSVGFVETGIAPWGEMIAQYKFM
ncbi:diamine N-acetyltransferase [Paenibacillus sp. DS2015]|uniref:GNAT family N-acetyltransferase n=1 Tax=Paenibacillus sp. DS2015 TaxID=3373917 RepID=UPI003D19EAF9